MSERRRPPAPKPAVRMLSPLRDFLHTETSGSVLLALGAIAALIWANSPWSGSYASFWQSHIGITVAGHGLDLTLQAWINDAAMAVFFFVVGLEIKRELTEGHLSSRRTAMLPVAAALGGMLVPALLYLVIAGGSEPRGWAIPMATDIALALGVVAVAAKQLPPTMRAFLLGLAIVDDIGAIVVIAAFYSDGVTWSWLAIAVAALAGSVVVRRLGFHQLGFQLVLGLLAWFALHEAGIHATLAGVALGLLAPTTARIAPEFIDVEELADVSSAERVQATTSIAKGSVSEVEWLQHVLHPWTSYVIVPIFALANSGIEISADGLRDALRAPLTWGIIVGLVVGKPVGIKLASWIAVRAGVADPVEGSTPRSSMGVGAAAGIGFTVALFITELAFTDPARQREAKLAILVASVIAALAAAVLLRGRAPAPVAAPVAETARAAASDGSADET